VKILFVCSGNYRTDICQDGISPFVRSQGESLKKYGVVVDYYPIRGKGLISYARQIPLLKDVIKNNNYNIIHAHYVLCGWMAVFTRPKVPIVLSLMGDDAYGSYIDIKKKLLFSRYLTVLTLIIQPFVNAIISKSHNIEKYVYRKNVSNIVPNGVDLKTFKYFKNEYKTELKLDESKRYILFLGKKDDIRKNYQLAAESFKLLNHMNVELINPYPVNHDLVFKYLNSVDVCLLTSFIEGSPNIIKEAMASNCPIVSTDVGDVKWIIGNTNGCFITSFDREDVADKILRGIEYSVQHGRTNGRERILELGLDSDTIAIKIISIYKKLIL
jgi:teichuronic acid biosynthesis glycosyltransferase TuaC